MNFRPDSTPGTSDWNNNGRIRMKDDKSVEKRKIEDEDNCCSNPPSNSQQEAMTEKPSSEELARREEKTKHASKDDASVQDNLID